MENDHINDKSDVNPSNPVNPSSSPIPEIKQETTEAVPKDSLSPQDAPKGKLKVDVVSQHEISDGQQCSNCGTTKTPLWRRAPNGTLICNACGLYLRSNHTNRPVNLKKTPTFISVEKKSEGSCAGDGRCNGTGGSAACKGCPAYNNRLVLKKKHEDQIRKSTPEKKPAAATTDNSDDLAIACYNCSTTITPLWRRDDSGNTICNACGLYYKLHGSHRPVKMKKTTIKRRKRGLDNTKASSQEPLEPKRSHTEEPVSRSPQPRPQLNQAQPGLPQMNQPQHQFMQPMQMQSYNIPIQAPQAQFASPNVYGLAPHHFPPYNGLGRIPNGPGPFPGPPPPGIYNLPLLRPSSQPLPSTQPLPSQQLLPIPIPQIQLPAIQKPVDGKPLISPNSQTLSNYEESTTNSIKSSPPMKQQLTPPREHKTLAVDFTSSFKGNKISIGGLLNK